MEVSTGERVRQKYFLLRVCGLLLHFPHVFYKAN